MNELDTIVLAHDISEHELKKGDVGVIVHIYENGKAFEVEFVTTDGKTIAVLTLNASDVRSMGEGEILHVRELSSVLLT
jgi:hypothetical protein